MSLAPFHQQVVFLRTEDLDTASWFYGQGLGLPLVLDQGVCRIFQVSADGYLGVCSHRGAPRDADSVTLTLVTDDVDGWADVLRARGLELEGDPATDSRFNIRHVFLRDPDGYLVEIQQFLDPAWPKADRR